MVRVRKRRGFEEEWIPEKMIVSLAKAGVPADIARRIVKEFENKIKGKDSISTDEIREFVLEKLKEISPEAYTNWIYYEKLVKKRVQKSK